MFYDRTKPCQGWAVVLAWAAVGLVCGAVFRPWPATWDGGLALAVLTGASLLAAAPLIQGKGARAVVAGLLVFGSVVCGAALGRGPPGAPLPSGVARLTGEVLSEDADRFGDRMTLRVRRGAYLNGPAVNAGAVVLVRGISAAVGDELTVVARLRPVTAYRNPSPHPPWPRGPGPAAFGSSMAPPHWHHRSAWGGVFHRVRCAVRIAFARTLTPRHASLASALILGDGGAPDPDTREDVRNAGLAHVLAVSGLHVAIVLGMMMALVRWIAGQITVLSARWDVGRMAAAVGIPLALAMAEFAGGSASAWRAAVTAAVMQGAVALGRRPSPLGVTALTTVIFALATPHLLPQPSFVLSIVATVAVLTAPRSRDHGAGAVLMDAMNISLRSIVATLPVTLWCFERTAWIGVVANVVAVPLSSWLLIPLGVVHGAAACAHVGSGVTGALFAMAADAFLGLSAWFAQVPGITPPPLTVLQGLCIAGLSFVWLYPMRWRARGAWTAALLVALALGELRVRSAETPHALRITFLDVGQGDGALVDLPDGHLLLVDAGGSPNGGPDPGAEVIVPLLRARRRTRIDTVVITHAHPDHYGGLAAVLDAVPVRELWVGSQGLAENPRGEFAALVRAARLRGTVVRTEADLCTRPRTGIARVTVLGPCPSFDPGYDLNENSLAFRIDAPGASVLFTGDMGAHAEAQLVAQGRPLRATVLKVGHHGSRTSTSLSFLRAVSPAFAVVSAGAQNRFGHPHPEVTERLVRAGTTILRTDRRGGCTAQFQGASPTWTCAEDETDD